MKKMLLIFILASANVCFSCVTYNPQNNTYTVDNYGAPISVDKTAKPISMTPVKSPTPVKAPVPKFVLPEKAIPGLDA